MLPGMEMLACPNLAVPPEVMQHIVQVESGANPYAIGVVGGQLARQPRNLDEALATARMLESKGYNFSVGIAQVNRANLGRYGLDSYRKAFNTCANLAAGAQILAELLRQRARRLGQGVQLLLLRQLHHRVPRRLCAKGLRVDQPRGREERCNSSPRQHPRSGDPVADTGEHRRRGAGARGQAYAAADGGVRQRQHPVSGGAAQRGARHRHGGGDATDRKGRGRSGAHEDRDLRGAKSVGRRNRASRSPKRVQPRKPATAASDSGGTPFCHNRCVTDCQRWRIPAQGTWSRRSARGIAQIAQAATKPASDDADLRLEPGDAAFVF